MRAEVGERDAALLSGIIYSLFSCSIGIHGNGQRCGTSEGGKVVAIRTILSLTKRTWFHCVRLFAQ